MSYCHPDFGGAEEEKKRREVKSLSWRKGLQTSQQPLSS